MTKFHMIKSTTTSRSATLQHSQSIRTASTERRANAGLDIRLGTSEVLFGAALGAFAFLLAVVDGLGSLLGRTHLVSLANCATFLFNALRDPGNPSSVWPGPAHHFPAVEFWVLLALAVMLPLVVIALLARRRHRYRDIERGFATRRQVHRVISLDAAQRQANVTRPSINARDAQATDVGYSLGTSISPRGVRLVASFEHSLELVAPPGSGKTLRVLAPIIRHHPGPVLATSTKPDLYETTAIARERLGPVFALDPDRLCPAAPRLRWSPVSGCIDPNVAERRAGALVAASGDGADVHGGGFFRRSAATVLAAYLHAAALSDSSMRDVLSWASRPSDQAPLRILSGAATDIDWAARLHGHTSGAAETTSGVMRTVDLALACFSDPAVLAQITPLAGEAFSFESFFDANGSVYALGKDRGAFGGSGPLITAFADELVVEGELRAAAQSGRRLDPPLLACLDEAPSIAALPGLPALVADGRGRGIVVLVAMQSFSQAEARWGKDGAATVRNAASVLMVFGGLSVAADLEELSKLCGTRLVERFSLTEGGNGHASTSRHHVEEPVLSPAAIHSLDGGVALVLVGRLPPVLSYLPGIWEGDDANEALAEETQTRIANDAARVQQDHPGSLIETPSHVFSQEIVQ